MNKHCILFEHEVKRILNSTDSRENNDKKFIELTDYLEHISRQKNKNPFFDNSNLENKKSQKILNLDWSDYSVSANQFIGIIQTQWCRFTILPKIFSSTESQNEEELINKASNELMYLLSYAYDLKNSDISQADFSKNKNLDFFEIFISLFATKTWEVLNRNVYHKYENIEENIGFVKGKILFNKQLKENALKNRNDRLYCEYTLFQEDNILNQIIKYVTKILFRKSRVETNKSLLRKILHILSDINDKTFIADDTDKVTLSPMQREFAPILNYCKLFLENSLIKFNQNNVDIFCFLIDMNSLFEKFVVGFLKEHFKNDWKVESQKSDKSVATDLSGNNVFQMRHDIFLTSLNTENSIIIDTKYKFTDFSVKKGGISQGDVYQMITYAIRRHCENLILLYPKYNDDNTSKEIEYRIKDEFGGNEISLKAFKLDLTNLEEGRGKKDESIKNQLQEIFNTKTLKGNSSTEDFIEALKEGLAEEGVK